MKLGQTITCLWFINVWINEINAQSCTGTAKVGDPNPSSNSLSGTTGQSYLVCGAPSTTYDIDCCGSTTKFEYYAQSTGSVVLQLWRPVSGTTYKLVGSVSDTVTTVGLRSVAAVFQVQTGDCFGWYSAGEIITYPANSGAGAPSTTLITGPTTTVIGSTQSFALGTTTTNRRYSVNVEVKAANLPVFGTTTFTTGSTILDSTAGGVSLATVTFTDAHFGQALAISMATNNYFKCVDNGNGTASVSTTTDTIPYPISALSGTSVTLTFSVTDLCGTVASGTVTIVIQNLKPTLTGLSPGVTTSETVDSERQISTYTCTDTADSVTSSLDVTPSTTPEFFVTRFLNGTYTNSVYEIIIPIQSAALKFNYDTINSYTIVVKCSDSKPLGTASATLVVSLSPNQPPEITNLPLASTVGVSQTTTNGAVIFTVQYSDPDPDDTVDFTWTCSPTGCPFIVLNSGEVQMTDDMSNANANGYDVTITPNDNRGNVGNPRILTVVVTELNTSPVFSNVPVTVPIDENTVVGTSVFKVSFTDADAVNSHTFTLGASSYFQMQDTTSGIIRTKTIINFEALGGVYSYALQVTVSDGIATVTSTVTFTISDVNEALVWNAATYRTNVPDGAAVGTLIPDPGFDVTDEDTGDTYKCYMNCAASPGYFGMTSACVIKVTSVYSLDAGLTSPVTCTVTAVDIGSHTSTTTLIISIDDANNYVPVFSVSSQSFSLSNHAGSGTTVGTVTATDGDVGTFGTFTYTLDTSSVPGNYFRIDGTTGVISTTVDVRTTCNCTGSSFTMTVTATDAGGLTATMQLVVFITETTTAVATTTTDRFRTFFEDPKNIAWFTVAMIVCVAIVVMSLVVFCQEGPKAPPICRNPCKARYKFITDRLRSPGHLRGGTQSVHIQEPIVITQTIRKPPPPKGEQLWRSQYNIDGVSEI